MLRTIWLIAALCLTMAAQTASARPFPPGGRLDMTPRTAIMTAMPPEMVVLQPALTHPHRYDVDGVVFWTGELEGRPVVLFLSGVSMTNAAMNTQLALDHFAITRIVFSGVAGGVDPALHVGDVVVAAQWGPYMEARFQRQIESSWPPPQGAAWPGYGMIYPHSEPITGPHGVETRFWYPADARLLAAARDVAGYAELRRCVTATHCLAAAPRIVVGGNGLSASVFMDNGAFRDYLFATFHAQAVDMETAAVAQVAYVRGVPFIAFRSLSDLAGGEAGENGFATFVGLAAENAATTLRAFLRALPD